MALHLLGSEHSNSFTRAFAARVICTLSNADLRGIALMLM
jgi:hypothetical protein